MTSALRTMRKKHVWQLFISTVFTAFMRAGGNIVGDFETGILTERGRARVLALASEEEKEEHQEGNKQTQKNFFIHSQCV